MKALLAVISFVLLLASCSKQAEVYPKAASNLKEMELGQAIYMLMPSVSSGHIGWSYLSDSNKVFWLDDTYKTAPLYNVEKTAPYGHSGSVNTLNEAIVPHYDPLSLVSVDKLNKFDRYELTKRLGYADSTSRVGYLTPEEVSQVASFLKTLSFNQ